MHPHGLSCWALLAQSPKQAFLLIFIEEKGWSRCTSRVKDVLVIKWVLKAAPYVNVVPITCLFVATKDLHLFREEKRRAMGRCAAAAPISGQTLAVCFLQENIACYASGRAAWAVAGLATKWHSLILPDRWLFLFYPTLWGCSACCDSFKTS